MKRKRPQKKVVVKKVEWLESPTDQECQEGKCDKITFTARLSEKEKRGKWYLMNSVSNVKQRDILMFKTFNFVRKCFSHKTKTIFHFSESL